MCLQKLFRSCLLALACCWLLLGSPVALAQTPTPSPASIKQEDAVEVPAAIEVPATQKPMPANEQPANAKKSQPKASRASGKTYPQPPHPYDMEGMEAYDEELYGAGR